MKRVPLFFLAVLFCMAAANAQKKPILFQHVRVFDGTQVLINTNVLIENGEIKAIGPDVTADSAEVVDGTGRTLLPGLIDSHAHVHGRDKLEQALDFGVTSEMDLGDPARFVQYLKSQVGDDCASFWSAGPLATVPGGHGAERDPSAPTLVKPSEAEAWVEARVREGSDYIKIVYDDGSERGRNVPTLSKATMAALIAAAHKNHKLAIVHIGSLRGARDAIEAGADGLAHLFIGGHCDADFGQFAAAHHAFVIPTLTVHTAVCGPAAGPKLISDPSLGPCLSRADKDRLREEFPSARRGLSCQGQLEAIRQLKAAGAPILAGSDVPNPGTAQGASLHQELELLVEAGLTPIEALASATSAPARAYHVPDRGRIAPGLRADLLLVAGHPDENILATRNIVAVYKHGIENKRRRCRPGAAN